jgi:PAS domain-containing protein
VAPGDGGVGRDVDVEAVPITSPGGDAYYLVLFKERPKRDRPPKSRGTQASVVATKTGDSGIQRELDETREQLDTAVAEREAANRDLRATSERFQSSNEELRTINEEFQTAQEELQSTNEELTTLNDELRSRNTELGVLADDLNNVLESVEIPILILDADLHIRRFTPQTQTIVSIVPSDVGRPITDLSLKVRVPDFRDMVREVLRHGVPEQREAQGENGRWYSIRVRPYKTGEGATEGVVIAFIDIDELKKTGEITEAAREHAEAVVETVREPLLTLEADLRVREANDAFYQTFLVSPDETIGRDVFALGDRQWDFPELRSLLERVLPGDEGFANLVVERSFPRIGDRVMELYARRVREESGEPSILLAVNDMTEVSSRQRLSQALNNVSIEIVSTLEFDQILERVLKQSSDVLGASSAAVLVQQNGDWVVKNAHGLPRRLVDRVLDEQKVPGGATLGEAPVILGVSEAADFTSTLGLRDPGAASVLVVPLIAREERIGFVSFHYRFAGLVLGDPEMDFARRLGTLISLGFENARLYATQRQIAETLQEALLTAPKRVPGLDFGYLYRSATVSAAVGGDFFDIFELDGGLAGVLLGDVSGKGVQAATLTALVKNTIRTLAYENVSPAVVMQKANAVIFKATSPSLFVTITFCVLDVHTGRLVYCSAGHTRSIVRRRAGEVELLDVGSPLAGAFESAVFTDGETTLDRGDVLILYTDGVTEARSDGDLFGEERLVESVANMPPTRPRKVPEAIFDQVMRYTGGTLSDDVAIIAVARSDKD